MRFTRLVGLLLLCLGFRAAAQTTDGPVRSLSMAECIQMALQNNLDVQFARYNPLIQRFTLEGSYSAYDPTASFRYTRFFSSQPGGIDRATALQLPSSIINGEEYTATLLGDTPFGLNYNLTGDLTRRGSSFSPSELDWTSAASITLNQHLLKDLWIDLPSMTIQVNKKNLKVSEMVLLLQMITSINDVQQSYYELIFNLENIKVQEKAVETSARFLFENQQRVKVGTMAPLDEQQAHAELALNRANLLGARQMAFVQQNTLKRLVKGDLLSWPEVRLEPSEKLLAVAQQFNLPDSWRRGVEQRPDYLQVKLEVEKQNIVLRFNRNQLFPTLDLTGSFGENGLNTAWEGAISSWREGDNPRHSYGFLFSIPLSLQGPRSEYKRGKAFKEQLIVNAKRVEQLILVNIEDFARSAQSDFEIVDLMRQSRVYREAALDAEQKKLENGKSTSFLVLQAQRELTAARSSEIRALADYNKALAWLDFWEGSTLQKNGIAVQFK